jgi:hypothetical protein
MTSYVYIIGADAPPYKVGISRDPVKRLKALQTGHPARLKIHHVVATPAAKTRLLETVIHANLKLHRCEGEWFDIPLDKLKLEVEYVMIRYADDPVLGLRVKQGLY